MSVHADEVPAGVEVVRHLLATQCPDLADRPVEPIGAGTDNTMYRLGDDLLARLPRTPGTVPALAKELRWLPVLAPALSVEVPEPVRTGEPDPRFPLPWAVYRWIPGTPPTPGTVADWARLGRDLGRVVAELHATDLGGQERAGDLAGYRGGPLAPHDAWLREDLETLRGLPVDLDADALLAVWEAGLALPPDPRTVWLHGDLRPGNLLAHDGALRAVIDFGGLGIGAPSAEHAPLWDLPGAAREAYREVLDVPDDEWTRARAWAVLVGVSGVTYYWSTFPAFVAECRARLAAVLAG